jgi:hypothetical protein
MGLLAAAQLQAQPIFDHAQPRPLHPQRPQFYEAGAVLWQGFTHRWTYNHRWQWFADYVHGFKDPPGRTLTYRHFHGAAGRQGADQAGFTSHYAAVFFNDVRAQTGQATFQLTGRLNQVLERARTVRLQANKHLRGREQYTVALNGFELKARGAAWELQMLQLQTGTAGYDYQDSSLTFSLNANMMFGCKPLLCGLFRQAVDYQLTVHYIILGGKAEAFSALTASLKRSDYWDTKLENPSAPNRYDVTADTSQIYKIGAVGIKGFRMLFDQPQRYLGWELYLLNQRYEPYTGTFTLQPNFHFEQWQDNMREASPAPWYGFWAPRRDGAVEFQVEALLLQFREGCLRPKQDAGQIKWPGGGRRNSWPAASTYTTRGELFQRCPER